MSNFNDERSVKNNEPILPALVRFFLEVVAWIAIGLAFGWLFAIIAVLAMALFSTPGDKRKVIVPVPGPIRLLLEVGVFLIGVAAAGLNWGVAGALVSVGLFALYLLTNRSRLAWLMSRPI